MNEAKISKIVPILTDHDYLIQKWSEFKDALKIRKSFVQIQIQYQSGVLNVNQLFREIISAWIAETGKKSSIGLLCATLNEIGCRLVAEQVKAAFPKDQSASDSSELFFKIPLSSSNLVERKKKLEELNVFYCDSKTDLVKVVGMGGVGKSEIVKNFAYSKKTEVNGIWLNGESAESLQKSVLKLAKLLQIQTTKDKTLKRSDKILKDIILSIQLKNNKQLLLIIDNVDTLNEDVVLATKTAKKLRCFILVTSRNITALGTSGEIVNLNVLEDTEAHTLISDTFKDESDENIKKLCQLLQNFPLAIQQAIAYIKYQTSAGLLGKSYKINNYLSDYEKGKGKMLKFELSVIDHKYDKTTFVTWNVSIEQIRRFRKNATLLARLYNTVMRKYEIGEFAIQLLNLIAYFEADAICIDFISRLHKSTTEIEDALMLLKTFSLIKIENRMISIHRLVQEVTRVNCLQSNRETDLLQKYIKIIENTRDSLEELDMSHVFCLWKYASKYPAIVKNSSSLSCNIVNKLEDLQLFQNMEMFASQSCLIFKVVLGKEDKVTLRMNEGLARSVMHNGKYDESLEMYKELVNSLRSILGEVDETTLLSRGNMGWVLYHLERYDEALEMYKSVLDLRLTAKLINFVEVMELKENMAHAWSQKREFGEAIRLFHEVLDWRKKELGEQDRRTLIAESNIAFCLYHKKEYERARGILERLLTFPQPPLTLLNRKELLASVYVALGDQQKGVEMQIEVVSGRTRILLHQHPHTLLAKDNLHKFSRNELL